MMKYILTLPFLVSTLAFADDSAPAKGGNYTQLILMLGLALVFSYFILWRPEQRRRKAMQKQRESMKKGDRVTAMGMIGTISKIQENTIILKTCDGSKIEILKAAITDVQPSTTQEAEEKSTES